VTRARAALGVLTLGATCATGATGATGCLSSVPLDTLTYTCRADDDCPAGQRCLGNLCSGSAPGLDASRTDVDADAASPGDGGGVGDGYGDDGGNPGNTDAGPHDAHVCVPHTSSTAVHSGFGVGPPPMSCFPPEADTTPETDAWWCTGIDAPTLDAFIARQHAEVLHVRRIDADGVQTYSVALQRDQGHGRHFFHDTESCILPAGLVALESTPANGYAGVTLDDGSPGTGWYLNATEDFLVNEETPSSTQFPGQGARIVALSAKRNGTNPYELVMRPRSWPHRRASLGRHAYFGLSPTAILLQTAADRAHVDDFVSTAFGVFTLIEAEDLPTDPASSFVSGLSADALSAMTGSTSRVRAVQPMFSSLGWVYAAVLVSTPTGAAARIAALVNDRVEGPFRLLVEPLLAVRGATLTAAYHADESFEPGAALFPLIVLHALRQVDSGTIALATVVSSSVTLTVDGCSTSTVVRREPLETALLSMIVGRDRARARALIARFGAASIAETAAGLGMGSTVLDPDVGCTGHPNRTTLSDLAALFRGAVGGLSPASWTVFEVAGEPQRSDRGLLHAGVAAVATSEGHRFGWTDIQIGGFVARLGLTYGLGTGAPVDSAGASGAHPSATPGLARIPTCGPGGAGHTDYLFGASFEAPDVSSPPPPSADFAAVVRGQTPGELLREPIREAMRSGASCLP
jgi:hypothetical protein